mmetsp:Transcript_20186/g.42275  ORF Transcript_20186/g.42275 Transcript_20186/m.42275 type:complete len:85 (-) Transcript_20186:196-450(-)
MRECSYEHGQTSSLSMTTELFSSFSLKRRISPKWQGVDIPPLIVLDSRQNFLSCHPSSHGRNHEVKSRATPPISERGSVLSFLS